MNDLAAAPMSSYAALLFTLLTAFVGVFQIALMLGAPWGELTLGGRWRGSLPPAVRLIPLLSLLLLGGFGALILARAGLAFPALFGASRQLVWLVVAYCMLGAVVNFITPSRAERRLWFPVVLCMAILSLLVALA